MNKIKIVQKKDISQIVIKSQKGQQVSERDVYSINNNEVRGLLHLEVENKSFSFKVIYNINGFISLKTFLASPLTKEVFARILQSILTNLKSMQNAFFKQEHLLMDFDYVMINPATQTIYFAYVPIQGFETSVSLRDFLLNIIDICTFVQGEDTSYVKDYITILNNGINFSIFELEQYIKKLSGIETDGKTMIECPGCHSLVVKGKTYCDSCGMKLTGHTGNFDKKGVYDPFSGMHEKQIEQEVKEEQPRGKRYDNTQGLSDSTTVLNPVYGGTTVLGAVDLETPNYPYLIRERDGEKILIDKPTFRIGKERKYCDYFIDDNNYISRSHADIITKGKRYYINDLNSTNRTYVDGRVIPVEQEVEIFSGTRIKLANEEFVFFIEG